MAANVWTAPVNGPVIQIIQGTDITTVVAAVAAAVNTLNKLLWSAPNGQLNSGTTSGNVQPGSIQIDPVQPVSVNNVLNYVVSIRYFAMAVPS